MTNITKCNGVNCEARLTCYRFTAPKNEWDLYFIETPIENGGCEYYVNHNKIWTDQEHQDHNTLTPEINANIEKGADLFVKNIFPIIKKLSKE
jgi:hypothetical protein